MYKRQIVEMRERDLKLALEDEHYKRLAYEQFTRLQKKAYPVVESNTKDCLLYTSHVCGQEDVSLPVSVLTCKVNP